MNILEALASSATQEVQAGPCHWRIRRVTTSELVQAGGTFLLMAKRVGANGDDAEAVAKAVQADPSQFLSGVKFQEALVAAGVVAVSADGKEWVECRVVLDPRQESASAGRLHVSALPPGALNALSYAVMQLSKDGGAADERISSFLGAAAPPPRRPRR